MAYTSFDQPWAIQHFASRPLEHDLTGEFSGHAELSVHPRARKTIIPLDCWKQNLDRAGTEGEERYHACWRRSDETESAGSGLPTPR